MIDVVIENESGLLLCHECTESRLMVDCRDEENRVIIVFGKIEAKKLRDYIDAWLRSKE